MIMKIPVYGLNGESKGEINAAKAFSQKVRTDLIRKAFKAEQSKQRQPYGTDPLAGQRTSAHYHGRRSIRHSMMNREMARMKRIHGTGFMHMRARFVPQAIKGRRAHPPSVERVWEEKMNKKEHMKALFSAIAATKDKEMVVSRGHRIDNIKHMPLVLDDKVTDFKKSKELVELLKKLGLEKEMERVSEKKIRAGRGTSRGRKYVTRKGPLMIISGKDFTAGRNLMGFDTVNFRELSVGLLAPGASPGRLTIWTKSALEEMEKMA
jgi:large subunit ribosomal protein L4e